MASTLQLYDSLRGEKVPFEPLREGFVGMYVCGPTVYSPAHLGNCRTFVSFDVIFRTLRYLGNRVRYVRNVTDVGHLLDDGEDRMSRGARQQKLEPMEVAQTHTVGFHEMLRVFNCLPPSIEPRATGHIIEQVEMIGEIVAAGMGYESNGSVYFDVPAFTAEYGSYGELSGRKVDELLSDTRDTKGQSDKRHPTDFAIWMKAGPDHLMRWSSPWSVGFPGWHLECSAMSRKYLGDTFDIHGGGNDLKFPHHENEIAQNEAATGRAGARYWMHTNMLLLNGKKMSKSDGNYITPDQLISGESEQVSQGYAPMVVRFFMLQAHYGSPLDMSDEALLAAEKGYRRLVEGLRRAGEIEPTATSSGAVGEELQNALAEARAHMLDDFNTPRAIASLFEAVGLVNALANGQRPLAELGAEDWRAAREELHRLMHDVLGLQPETGLVASAGTPNRTDGLMQLILELRAQSRADRNWSIADKIRDELAALEIEVQDGRDGSSFTLK